MKCDLSKITCIEDLRLVAKRKMPRMFYDFGFQRHPFPPKGIG